MLGGGGQWRDLLHAEDAAQALLALTVAREASGVVDIGDGLPTALATVAQVLATLAGAAQTGLGGRPDRPGDPVFLVASPARIHATGWRPEVTVEQGLEQTFAWWRDQLGGRGR